MATGFACCLARVRLASVHLRNSKPRRLTEGALNNR